MKYHIIQFTFPPKKTVKESEYVRETNTDVNSKNNYPGVLFFI